MAFDPDKYLSEKSGAQASAPSAGFDPDAYLKAKMPSPGLIDSALETVGNVGRAIDSYTGAPVRAAIGAYQEGQSPTSAYAQQFGEDPSKAPTGADIAAKAGMSTKRPLIATADQQRQFDEEHNPGLAQLMKTPGMKYEDKYQGSPAENAGLLVDAGADPINALPLVGEAAKALGVTGKVAKVADVAGDALKSAGEHAAVNATGATAVQASKFADNAGRELLDKGVVKFGDNQAKIAQRAQKALSEANKGIDSALTKLHDAGVTVDANDVKTSLQNKIKELSVDPSNADVIRQLEGEIQNIDASVKARGSSQIGIKDAEGIKRGYNRKAGNWMDPEKSMAGKESYQAWRQAVEDAAIKADPATAADFGKAKEAYGIMAPIQEAAERRALQVNQHPLGGFLDMTSAVVGHGLGGPLGGVVAPVARRAFAPRLASATAQALDKSGNLLKVAPKLVDATKTAGAVKAVETTGQPTTVLKVADQEQPQKGPTKWAQDGVQKLLDHGADKDLMSKAQKDPAVRSLLIQASDLKPGSKAMSAVMDQLKQKLASGED